MWISDDDYDIVPNVPDIFWNTQGMDTNCNRYGSYSLVCSISFIVLSLPVANEISLHPAPLRSCRIENFFYKHSDKHLVHTQFFNIIFSYSSVTDQSVALPRLQVLVVPTPLSFRLPWYLLPIGLYRQRSVGNRFLGILPIDVAISLCNIFIAVLTTVIPSFLLNVVITFMFRQFVSCNHPTKMHFCCFHSSEMFFL
jgi:hypothetical protein